MSEFARSDESKVNQFQIKLKFQSSNKGHLLLDICHSFGICLPARSPACQSTFTAGRRSGECRDFDI
jgi:hypothetical protein